MSDTPNIARILDRLSATAFRRQFRLGRREIAYLARIGETGLTEHAQMFVAQRLAPATPRNDGKQTPFRGHPVFIAQHATATCCRGCLAKWHGIPEGQPLSSLHQGYVVSVIAAWIGQQSAGAPDTGEIDAVLPQSHQQLMLIRD